MEHKEAFAAIEAHRGGTSITKQDVMDLLQNVKGTTFAGIAYVTKVATAVAHKAMDIKKVTIARVQLFNNIQDYKNVYEAAVKRSAEKFPIANEKSAVDNFEAQSNWFEHTDCFSVVKHKTQEKFYLYSIYNKAESLYVIDNKVVDKHEVAKYLTKSAAEKLLDDSGINHNVTHDVYHSVTVRAVELANIVSITAQKSILLK